MIINACASISGGDFDNVGTISDFSKTLTVSSEPTRKVLAVFVIVLSAIK